MLTPLDDSLWHQLPTTFDHVGTSDPRFFDRYWFAINAPDGRTAIQLTLGAYRNMNVVDAAVVVVRDGRQYNLRASRSLGTVMQPTCGPITVEVVEPLQEFRLLVRGESNAIIGEITWRGVVAPHEERPHFERHRGRVREEYQRFDQIGVASGWIEVHGNRIEINDWWACRDHSWGVRPRIGIREPVTGPVESLQQDGFVMAFLFFSTEAHAGHVLTMQRGEQTPYSTGTIASRHGGVELEVASLDLEPQLVAGTRRFSSACLTARLTGGEQVVLEVEANGAAVAMQGLGYSGGYVDGRGLGVWRAEQHLESDVWDVSHAADIVDEAGVMKAHWHRIQPVKVSGRFGAEREPGFGSMTLIFSGHLPRFGLA